MNIQEEILFNSGVTEDIEALDEGKISSAVKVVLISTAILLV